MALLPTLSEAVRAFPTHPRIDRYFAADSSESARQRLRTCLTRGDGPALLLGAPGVGKTMLLEALAAELDGELRVVRLAGGQLCTRRALLQAILHGLGLPYRDRDEGELRLLLADELNDTKREPRAVALLIDEAQTFPTRLLEELRLLSNHAVKGSPRLRPVLAGSHALDEALTAPELEALSQRIAARCYLEPLGREETARYVRAHLAAVGGDPDRLLADDAYDAFWRASDGLPRLLNQVAERAMQLAEQKRSERVDGATVGEAWSDLHQLAAPWQSPASARLAAASSGGDSGSAVEFGTLDDEDEFGEALHAEAAAVTEAAAAMLDLGSGAAVWNADHALDQVTGRLRIEAEAATPEADLDAGVEEEDAADDGELVSYAFPSLQKEIDEAPEEEADPTVTREQFSVEPEPSEESAPSESEAPRATDPFDEEFDEEEILLDPQSQLERVIPPAPVVVAIEPTEVGIHFAASGDTELDAIEDEAEAVDDAPTVIGVEEVVEEAVTEPAPAPLAGVGSLADEDDPIVLVEPDEAPTVDSPSAHRQDYRQLFATLRHG